MCGASFRVYHDQKMTFLGAPGCTVRSGYGKGLFKAEPQNLSKR